MRLQLLDISRGLSFLHSLEVAHGDLKGVRLDFFLCYARPAVFIISHLRIIFLLTGRVVRNSMISGLLVSLVSTARRLLRPGLRGPFDGWHRNSSASDKMWASPLSRRPNLTFSHWVWSLTR